MQASQAIRISVLLICAAAAGCGTRARDVIPHTLAGEVAPDYRLGDGRGVVLARIDVSTQGKAGFGAITNPLIVELRQQGTIAPDENPQGLSLPSPNARVWGSPRDVPTVWQYREPGLMAASMRPASYDGLVMAYPERDHFMEDSIPAPSQFMRFAPIEIPADEIVYIGDIEIRQAYSFWDRALDRVQVSFAVRDDYERSVSEFRARYPQFRDTPVHKRLAQLAPPAP